MDPLCSVRITSLSMRVAAYECTTKFSVRSRRMIFGKTVSRMSLGICILKNMPSYAYVSMVDADVDLKVLRNLRASALSSGVRLTSPSVTVRISGSICSFQNCIRGTEVFSVVAPIDAVLPKTLRVTRGIVCTNIPFTANATTMNTAQSLARKFSDGLRWYS